MAEVTARTAPPDVPTSNALDGLPDDLLDTPPAYYSFGSTPAPMENPMAIDDVETFIVRVKCKGESTSVRSDGELRYGRKLEIQAAWKQGERPPTADDDEQPALITTDGQIEPETLGEAAEKVIDRPKFSSIEDGGSGE